MELNIYKISKAKTFHVRITDIKMWNLDLVRLEHTNTILRKRSFPEGIEDECGKNTYNAHRLVNM